MAQAVAGLGVRPLLVLVDGNKAPGLPCRTRTIVKGDARCLSIAAASIIAKVTRDRLMERLSEHDPRYGYASHAGYGTAVHLAALEQYGPSLDHRMSFAPLKNREPQG
jgi:ribonuclease HII